MIINMPNNIKLQIPINKKIKEEAERIAIQQGFSSLQDYIRFFITGLTQGKYTSGVITNAHPVISSEYESYLNQILLEYETDVKSGKQSKPVKSGSDLLDQLNNEE